LLICRNDKSLFNFWYNLLAPLRPESLKEKANYTSAYI
jgi:hypothetical protein